MYKNLFYFSLLLVYKSNTLSVYVSRIISRDTRRKKLFSSENTQSYLFFFFTIQDFFASISNDRSNNRRFIRKRSKRNFSLLLFVIPSVSPPFFSISFFPYSLYTLVSSLFVSYIFLINVKYLVVQGLREIIGKLLHRMLCDLNSRLDKYNSLEIPLKIRNIIVQYKNIDFWITNNIKKKK